MTFPKAVIIFYLVIAAVIAELWTCVWLVAVSPLVTNSS